MQQARKWLFRPKFFSSSKWAQFLHVTLDLTGKRCPIIFSAVLFFVFEKFSSTSTGGKCALRWFYCLEKQKLSLERTPPGKKLRFCIRYLWKMKEKPANLNRGLCFSIKWKATCRNSAHLDEEKNFGLKSHLRACCTQPFNYSSSRQSKLQIMVVFTKDYNNYPRMLLTESIYLYFSVVSDGEDGNGLKLEKKFFFKLSSSVSKNSPKLYCSLLFLLNFFDLLPSFVDRERFVCK